MKNGPYELVVAPDDFPGLKYRGRYCYEHTLVYWQNTGVVPSYGECIHHRNGEKRDNRFENLELLTVAEHNQGHGRGERMVRLCCPGCKAIFVRPRRNTHLVKPTVHTFCSRACIGKGLRYQVENVVAEFCASEA